MSVFITGASSGIGEAVRGFCEASLIWSWRPALDKLQSLAEELTSQFRVQVDTFELDVRPRRRWRGWWRESAIFDRWMS